MRPPLIPIAALLAILYLELCLLWKLGWSPYSPSDILTPVLETCARPFQGLHTPFALVRFYRQTKGPYKAPLINTCDEVSPGGYGVYLHPGYSMSEHKRFVGAEALQPHISFEYRHELGYHAEEVDEAMLEAVRADVGVDRVKAGCVVGGWDPVEMGEYDAVQHKLDVAMVLEELWGEGWVEEVSKSPGLFADLRGIDESSA